MVNGTYSAEAAELSDALTACSILVTTRRALADANLTYAAEMRAKGDMLMAEMAEDNADILHRQADAIARVLREFGVSAPMIVTETIQ